jgi:hypothetical protein
MRGLKQVLSKGDEILKVDGKEVTVRDLAHFSSLKRAAWPPRMSGLTVICQQLSTREASIFKDALNRSALSICLVAKLADTHLRFLDVSCLSSRHRATRSQPR